MAESRKIAMKTPPSSMPPDYQAAFIKQLEELKEAAERGEVTGLMYLVEEPDGTRRFEVVEDYATDPPEFLAEARATLEALLNGEDPAGGSLRH